MGRQRLRILLSNDDGVEAPGLALLAKALAPHHTVTVVAPSAEQSGIGHAFTFKTPLRYCHGSRWDGMHVYAVDGTPSDCVKFAMGHLLGFRPDAVVSGMNLGENTGTSSIYSGTVAAAREGALWRVPSFAFSIGATDATLAEGYAPYAVDVLDWILGAQQGELVRGRPTTFYNVNFPRCELDRCRGLRITRQSLAFFDDHYQPAAAGDSGAGFVLRGEKRDLELSDDYDSRALIEDFITLTPMCLDATDHGLLDVLRSDIATAAPMGGRASGHGHDSRAPIPRETPGDGRTRR